MSNSILLRIFFIILPILVSSRVDETLKRYVKVGSLQSHFSAYGSERAWNNTYYEGLIWPADYLYQDNSVIKRTWIATKNFTDDQGYSWGHYGVYLLLSDNQIGTSIFPMELYQVAKFMPPTVYVDGTDINSFYNAQIDSVNSEIPSDRIVVNKVNTSMGLTMERRVFAFSQQYHDNYFIKVYTFTNTGNTDWDDEIELTNDLEGVVAGWGTRYSLPRETGSRLDGQQSWGKNSWVTIRGEDYADNYLMPITEDDPSPQWLRSVFQWYGRSATVSQVNTIGAPYYQGNGRLMSPHHAGMGVIHVDTDWGDSTNDIHQPLFMGWHAGDTYPSIGSLSPSAEPSMTNLYDMLSGIPFLGLGGAERIDEIAMGDPSSDTYLNHNIKPFDMHNDGGGMNAMVTYGPFDIPHGESVTIVEVEGINGINRTMCEEIGLEWDKGSPPFILPDGSETDNKNIFKNSWVFTGKDSILKTFGRAYRNYNSGFQIPSPPLPPPLFDVQSGGDRIFLKWEPSGTEFESSFSGYEIWRAPGKADTLYTQVYSGEKGTYSFDDMTAKRGISYYYYIQSVSNGSNNQSGELNPTGSLKSSRFYTKTSKPAYLRRKSGDALRDIRIVPNPYHIAAKDFQYIGEKDKIMFLNIPGQCDIRVFTERGDLIHHISHNDGSGDEAWNLVTSGRQVVAPGIYLAHILVSSNILSIDQKNIVIHKGDSRVLKFVVIR
jgi:hypothetical protein